MYVSQLHDIVRSIKWCMCDLSSDPFTSEIRLKGTDIKPSQSVRSLGVSLDQTLPNNKSQMSAEYVSWNFE